MENLSMILGKNGFVQLNAKDIVENHGGKFEFAYHEEWDLSPREGIKYFNEAVQKGYEIARTLTNDFKEIKKDKTLKATEIESLMKKIIAEKTDSDATQRVVEAIVFGQKNYKVKVMRKTSVVLRVVDNGDGTYTSDATYYRNYLDCQGDNATLISETPIFLDKIGKGNVRITSEELLSAFDKNEKLYEGVVKMLNEWNDIRIANNGNLEQTFEGYMEKVNNRIALQNRFITKIQDGQLF